ncbi:hypothetical protein, partial [Micromonospora sp. NPDC000018]|uniref:hypothetical protein n=1 Tax=Micromonospora sp. NPDC000018 TaxID=3154239 RepID=UPI0033262198
HSLLHEEMRRFFDGFPRDAHPMAVVSSAQAGAVGAAGAAPHWPCCCGGDQVRGGAAGACPGTFCGYAGAGGSIRGGSGPGR